MAILKYKLFGKDRTTKKPANPVHFADITFEELKNVKQRPSRYSAITVEVPCPNNPKIIHSLPLTQAKKYRFESVLRTDAHDALTPDWATPDHQPVSIPEKYDFSFMTEQNERVYFTKNQWNSLLFLTIPDRDILEVMVKRIGFKCKYLEYQINGHIVTIKAPLQLQSWLAANTEPETPVIDIQKEEMIQHGGGRRLALIGGRIVHAFPRFYDHNLPTQTHRFVQYIVTEYLTDDLDEQTPTVKMILNDHYPREFGLWGLASFLRITPEEMDQIIKEHQQIGKHVV